MRAVSDTAPVDFDDHACMRLALGFMTGTSLDGLDAAAVRLDGRGLALTLLDIPATVSRDFPPELASILRALSTNQPLPARDITAAARLLGELHADAARELVDRAGPPDLACAHGQTVFHAPPDSWQLLNPWPLAIAANCPVVCDLRGADLAAGGQGAPITPIADWLLFRDADESRAIINLGGFCNITSLPAGASPDAVRGADVCACNHLLNAASRLVLKTPFDDGGAAALRGDPLESATARLASLLAAQQSSNRSLGSGDELTDALTTLSQGVPPKAFLASVVESIARTIADSLSRCPPDRALIAGGSVRNAALRRSLSRALDPIPVEPIDALGVPAAHRESVAFALLGALCADRTPITLPASTGVGAPSPISGSWIDPRTP